MSSVFHSCGVGSDLELGYYLCANYARVAIVETAGGGGGGGGRGQNRCCKNVVLGMLSANMSSNRIAFADLTHAGHQTLWKGPRGGCAPSHIAAMGEGPGLGIMLNMYVS